MLYCYVSDIEDATLVWLRPLNWGITEQRMHAEFWWECMLKYDHLRGTEGVGTITYRLKPTETDFDEESWRNLAENRV